jgi:hypothetical protein
MQSDRESGADRGRVRRGRVLAARLIAMVALLGIAAAGWYPRSRPGPEMPTRAQPPRSAGALPLRVAPATLAMGRPNAVTITSPNLKAGTAADEQDLVLTIPELDWTRRVKPEALRQGLKEEIRPDAPGIFRIRVLSNGAEVAARAIAVVPPGEPDARDTDTLWKLQAGPPHLRDSGAFEIPVYAVAVRVRDGAPARMPSAQGVRLTLKDQDSGKEFEFLRIPAGQSLSNRLGVPITPRTSYRLVASDGKGLDVGPLLLSWPRNGPRLRLSATPAVQGVTGGGRIGAEATVRVSMTYEGRPAVPAQPIPVSVSIAAPSSVRVVFPSPSSSSLTIASDARAAECRLASAGLEDDAWVTFSEPTYATSATVRVRFSFPRVHFALVFVSGGIGVLVARRRDLAASPWWRVGLEVLIGGAAAVALYWVILAIGLRSATGARLGLDVSAALPIGLAGGLLGLTVLDLVVGAFQTIFAGAGASEGQVPPEE